MRRSTILALACALLDRLQPKRRNHYRGNYHEWAEARRRCAAGYGAEVILEKTRLAVREVIAGHAAYERDSVLFYEPDYNWQLLAELWRLHANRRETLSVLDFGGALGSTYWQHRSQLAAIPQLRWCIVEQPHIVECGRREFQNENLRFYSSIEECLSEGHVDLALFSSVLGYLPDFHQPLAAVMVMGVETIIIDKTLTLLEGARERIAIQHVPAWIYAARYPIRIFASQTLSDILSADYTLVQRKRAYDFTVGLFAPWQQAEYQATIWRRRCKAATAEMRK